MVTNHSLAYLLLLLFCRTPGDFLFSLSSYLSSKEPLPLSPFCSSVSFEFHLGCLLPFPSTSLDGQNQMQQRKKEKSPGSLLLQILHSFFPPLFRVEKSHTQIK